MEDSVLGYGRDVLHGNDVGSVPLASRANSLRSPHLRYRRECISERKWKRVARSAPRENLNVSVPRKELTNRVQ